MAVIPNSPPQLKPGALRRTVVMHYLKDGRIVVQKWPRRRKVKNPTTRDQVTIWDMVLEWVRNPEPSEFAWAWENTQGQAFYARDILMSSAYGNYISWPGHGWRALLSEAEVAALEAATAAVEASDA